MSRLSLPALAATAAIAALAPARGRAGLVLQLEERGHPSKMTLDGKKVRIDGTDGAGHVMIFDGDAQRLYQLDPAKKTYSIMTKADTAAVGARIKAALAKLPPEQRAAAEARKKSADVHVETKYEPTGARSTVAGFPCQTYRIVRGEKEGGHNEQGCLIPWSAGAVKKEDLAGLVEFGKFVQSFTTGMGDGGRGRNFADDLQRSPGFPATVERVEGEERTVQHKLVSLQRTSVSADTFEVPAGFAQVDAPALTGRRGKPTPK